MTEGRIDVHAHHLAPAYLEALHHAERWWIGGIPVLEWSPQLALEFMDAHGIAVQLLSISDPGVEFLSQDKAAPLARACNDYVAEVIAEHPGRFGGFAALAPRDVDAARAEVERALHKLGLHGVGLLSSCEGRYLGDPSFEPLLADLDECRAWVFVHPTGTSGSPSIPARWRPTAGARRGVLGRRARRDRGRQRPRPHRGTGKRTLTSTLPRPAARPQVRPCTTATARTIDSPTPRRPLPPVRDGIRRPAPVTGAPRPTHARGECFPGQTTPRHGTRWATEVRLAIVGAGRRHGPGPSDADLDR